MKAIKAVIFDWDGTVMDSTQRIASSMQSTAKRLALPLPSTQQVRDIIGLSIDKAFMALFGRLTESELNLLRETYRIEYVENNKTPSPLFEGVEQVLEELSVNFKLAVATGKGRQGLERVMAVSNTKHFFQVTFSADDAESKPHPDMVLKVSKALKLDPSECVMVGDTTFDMEMAKNAGMQRVGVSYGAHQSDRLAVFDPIEIIDDIRDLPGILRRQNINT
ncbi:MAG: HAD-IA family hydrolase [Pseudomonadota bacterium]